MEEFLTLEAMKTWAGQGVTIALLTEAIKRIARWQDRPERDAWVQLTAVALGIALQVTFVAWGLGPRAYVLGVINGVGVALAAMKGAEFVKGRRLPAG